MPESPLSPTTARQTPARSLLTHKDGGTGERAAHGDSCDGVTGETWHQKQVIFCKPTHIHFALFSLLHVKYGKQTVQMQKDPHCVCLPGHQTPKAAALLTVAGI